MIMMMMMMMMMMMIVNMVMVSQSLIIKKKKQRVTKKNMTIMNWIQNKRELVEPINWLLQQEVVSMTELCLIQRMKCQEKEAMTSDGDGYQDPDKKKKRKKKRKKKKKKVDDEEEYD